MSLQRIGVGLALSYLLPFLMLFAALHVTDERVPLCLPPTGDEIRLKLKTDNVITTTSSIRLKLRKAIISLDDI